MLYEVITLIQDDSDHNCIRIHFIYQFFHAMRKILFGAPLSNFDPAFASKGIEEQEQIVV